MDRHYSKPRQKATEGLVPSQTRGSTGSFFRALKTTSKVLAISLPLLLSKPVFSQTKVAVNIPEGKKTEMVKENKDTKAPTIFGQGKYFDSMEFDEKTGKLIIHGFRVEGVNATTIMRLNVRTLAEGLSTEKEAKKAGKTFSFEGLPLGVVSTRGNGIFLGVYLIYEDAIVFSFMKSAEGETHNSVVWANDGTKIFTHEGAIYADGNGNLLATTPTTLIAFTKALEGSYEYAKGFKDFPPLKSPNFSQTASSTSVDLRDPALVVNEQTAKLQIGLIVFKMEVMPDDLVIGAR